MQPVRMTKAEYEAQYGVKPVVATSSLDNDPIPVRMTRAEYNAKYRPNDVTFGQDVRRDYLSMGQEINTELQKGAASRQSIRQRVESGETSPLKGTFQTLGGGLFTGANVLGQTAMGLARTVLPQSFETKVTETLGQDLAKITAPETRAAFVERLKSSEGGVVAPEFTASLDEKAGKFLQNVGEAYKNDPNFRADVQATGGVLSWLSAPGVTKKAIEGGLDVAGDIAKASSPVTRSANEVFQGIKTQTLRPRNERAVERVSSEIADIENNYAKTRNKLDRDTNADNSRVRIAQSNVLQNAVDNDGLIRTKQKGGAIDQYKNTPITDDGLTLLDVEDVVKRNLEIENKKVNINELRSNMFAAVMDSGLEGADLAAAIKRIDKDLEGLTIRADEFGDVALAKLQDAKISTTKNIDYTKPVGTTYRKVLARVYKETIENKSDLPVREWNQELAKYYKDIDRLVDLDGKRVKGGRLGKYTANVAGSAVGAIAGTAGGGTGALIGGIVGGELAGAIKGRAMAGTFSRGVDSKMPQSQKLADAAARAKAGVKDLKTPDRVVGAPKDLLADPKMPKSVRSEILKVEGQIKKNVRQQKDAIKKGDFTLVAALKDVYTVLVDRLKQIISDYKKMTPGEKQGGFVGQNPFRQADQAKAKTAPANAQNISSNVDESQITVKADVEDDIVMENLMRLDPLEADPMDFNRLTELKRIAETRALNEDELLDAQRIVEDTQGQLPEAEVGATPQTTALLEEAKKYKSAEEKVRAIKQANLKTPEELIMAIEDLFPSKVAGKAEAYEQNVSVFFDMAPSKLAKQFQKELDSIESSAEWADRFSEVKLSARDYYNSVVSKAVANNTKNITSGFVYHGTNPRNLENIKKEGLKTGNYGNLYFAPTEEGIAGYGGGTQIKLRVKREFLGDYVEGGVEQGASRLGEIKTKTNIPPERLEIFKDGEWKPLISN